MSVDSSNYPEGPVSKSQKKREARAQLELARRLVDLSPGQLQTLSLPDRLRRAIEAAQRITQRVARKRETQFVAKLLRESDPEPVQAALEQLDAAGHVEAARHHRLERWRDALIEKGDPLIHQLCRTHGAADRQQIRQLVLKARHEAQAERPPAAARQLFRVLREIDQIQALPTETGEA